ncbi:hypothetical protein CIG37_03680 [Serratia marcescens]|nr:hypothetical protein [Serratia marcescens]OZP49980.1 hypothetical protein CIG46_02165 [Serratia marcescens]OZP54965.1 hypothetical protein CIG37_03680 [Serratia marcescens]OZP60046.1 hypothetical protein CIG56_03680 [Serratia marcescens]
MRVRSAELRCYDWKEKPKFYWRFKWNSLINQSHKKRPNTIPIFGLGKWLLGESRALKVGI